LKAQEDLIVQLGSAGAVFQGFMDETTSNEWIMNNLLATAQGYSKDQINVSESLFIALLATPEFDALTKSLLVPVTVFNAVQLIPNIEIGSAMRQIMRSQGMFKGIDEILDAYLKDAKNYLFGDFPFNADCSLEGII
jgi:hypothetical protein